MWDDGFQNDNPPPACICMGFNISLLSLKAKIKDICSGIRPLFKLSHYLTLRHIPEHMG